MSLDQTRESNVVSLQNPQKKSSNSSPDNSKEESLETVIKKNSENNERMRQERLKANKAVLKSYRIKN